MLIMFFALQGAGWGLYSVFAYDVWLGWVAVVIGSASAAFTLGSRSRKSNTC